MRNICKCDHIWDSTNCRYKDTTQYREITKN